MTFGFYVDGLEELAQKLRALSDPETVDGAVREGLMQAGRLVQASAKRNCPVDEGQLRNSIVVTPMENGVDVGTNVEHAIYNEYGTGRKGDPSVPHTDKEMWRYQDEDGNWHTTHGMAPRPFLYPALEEHKREIPGIVAQAIQRKIGERTG